jgi:hypothetical protein
MDPLAFLVKSFQSDGSVESVEAVLRQVHANIGRLDEEISAQVQTSRSLGGHIDETKALIESVVAGMPALQRKAADAVAGAELAQGWGHHRAAVGLDQALDSLAFLRQLRACMDTCARHRATGQYGSIAPLLAKQRKLVPCFRLYTEVPVVKGLLAEVEQFQEQLLNDILAEFRVSYGKVESDPDMMGHLAESARLMGAMGDHAANDLCRWFVEKKRGQLQHWSVHSLGQDWERLPPEEAEAAALASIPRSLADLESRYRWLRCVALLFIECAVMAYRS